MTFEEWLSDKYLGSMELEFSKDAFKAGAASRDAEIAELIGALEAVLWWDRNRNYIIPYRVRDPINAAIDKARKP